MALFHARVGKELSVLVKRPGYVEKIFSRGSIVGVTYVLADPQVAGQFLASSLRSSLIVSEGFDCQFRRLKKGGLECLECMSV